MIQFILESRNLFNPFSFHKTSSLEQDDQVGRKSSHRLCWHRTQQKSSKKSYLEGSQCPPQTDGVCWIPAGRCLSDAHSDIFIPLPPLKRPERPFCSCKCSHPRLLASSRVPGQFTNNGKEATWPLFRTSLHPSSPHHTCPSCNCSGQAAGHYWKGRCASPPDIQATFSHCWATIHSMNKIKEAKRWILLLQVNTEICSGALKL